MVGRSECDEQVPEDQQGVLGTEIPFSTGCQYAERLVPKLGNESLGVPKTLGLLYDKIEN
jgi:hypothetical protein